MADPGGNPTGMGQFTNDAGFSFVRLEEIVSPLYYTLTGQVRSHNPRTPITITLERANGSFTYTYTIPADPGGSGQNTQSFAFQNVEPGIYTLVVTKPGHLNFTIYNIIVTNSDIDFCILGADIALIPGSITGGNAIGPADMSALIALWGTSDPRGTLSGGGSVGPADISILMGNWGRVADIINFVDLQP
jgi:hypothetical protein